MSALDRVRSWVRRPDQEEHHSAESVFLVGLGRFGASLAENLVEMGVEVMAIDTDADLVDAWSNRLTHVRVADGTSTKVLEQLGATGFDAAVVAIGTGIEASVLCTSALADLGCTNLWAKAITSEHGRILERVGARHVVFPERDMGERVAHIVTGDVKDYVQLDEAFALVELETPPKLVGKVLGETGLRQRFGVTVVCRKPVAGTFHHVDAATVLRSGDLLVVAGTTEDTRRFTDFVNG